MKTVQPSKVLKWIPLISLATLIGGIFYAGIYWKDLQTRIFPTPADLNDTLDHNEQKPSDVETYILYKKLDSTSKAITANEADAIQSRAKRDTLTKKNAVSIYNIQKNQDDFKEVIQKIADKLEIDQ